MITFVSTGFPNRVVFGAGGFGQVVQEIRQLGGGRPLILCSPGRRRLAQQVAGEFAGGRARIYDQALRDIPVVAVHDARMEALRRRADGLVAIGGGSTIGLAKALTLREGIRIVAVPTTYSGCGMTRVG
ncbi:MAG: iron-containing alcohol dehydrogenase [Candidatus Binataceae bacterium]